jgi:hypothetical protein
MSTQPLLSSVFLVILDIIHLLKVFYIDLVICIINFVRFHFQSSNSDAVALSTFFRGKTVLITGASSGLGEALALKLAALAGAGKTDRCSIV